MDIIERLRFDAARCEAVYSKGVASNIEEAIAEIERLRSEIAQMRSQAGDNIELAESEQRGFERGLTHQQQTPGPAK